jgi:hypothetical protein
LTGSADGWYYDDPKSPSLIQLCAAPCTRINDDDPKSPSLIQLCAAPRTRINDDVTGHVDLVFGCKSKSVR